MEQNKQVMREPVGHRRSITYHGVEIVRIHLGNGQFSFELPDYGLMYENVGEAKEAIQAMEG